MAQLLTLQKVLTVLILFFLPLHQQAVVVVVRTMQAHLSMMALMVVREVVQRLTLTYLQTVERETHPVRHHHKVIMAALAL
jgi:hypothetical protein